MMRGDDWNGHGVGPLGWVFMIVMMLAVVALVVWLVTMISRSSHRAPHANGTAAPGSQAVAVDVRPSPEDVLAERLARGDIGVEEYRERVTVLRDTRPERPRS